MRPDLVVHLSPVLDCDLRIDSILEPLHSETLIPELSIEALVGAILPGLSRIDRRRLDSSLEEPFIRGVTDDGLKQYHGIPYAAPPLGNLRWAPTAPVVPWQDVLDASSPGPNCPQATHVPVLFYQRPEYPEQTGDCLTLNVWTNAVHAEERRPVMVWIHGGGL